ncbi:hypothetical protein J4225_00365 [Candidatus Pacearchaeota archaeon]|nr:hypothetical protein [uncultured archaeon]MBS3085124.1 hypothetical protein [Candidatus Pacearchaeota archaeon]
MLRQKESKLSNLLYIASGIFVISLVSIDYGVQRLKKAVYDTLKINYSEENGFPDFGYHLKRIK